MTLSSGPEIRLERRGGLVVVTLDRPRALNALSLAMCQALDAGLIAWQADPTVRAVLIKGTGERAFCAGGDIRALHADPDHRGDRGRGGFYALEYPMNARLHHFPKPYVALLDGITMGGGVGVSVHGSHRVVTERTVFAMPETAIGLFPDVGATYVLPRLPGSLGMHLGLTGARLGAADCRAAGIATHATSADRLEALEQALAEADLAGDAFAAVDRVLARLRCRSGSGDAAGAADADRSLLRPADPRGGAGRARRRAVGLGSGPARADRKQVTDQHRGHFPSASRRAPRSTSTRPCAWNTGLSSASWRGMIFAKGSEH